MHDRIGRHAHRLPPGPPAPVVRGPTPRPGAPELGEVDDESPDIGFWLCAVVAFAIALAVGWGGGWLLQVVAWWLWSTLTGAA